MLLLLKEVGNARLGESALSVRPQPLIPTYRKEERENSRKQKGIVQLRPKKTLALLLKPASYTLSNTGSARSFPRDTEMAIKVMRYCEVL